MGNFLLKNNITKQLACLVWLLMQLLLSDDVFGQLYTQTFSTIQVPLANDSLKIPPYCSSLPDNTQFTSIASSGPGAVFEVNPAGKLVLSRSSDVAVFTRAADFSPVPATTIWKFDISISGNNSPQINGAKFLTGFNLGSLPFGEESDANNIRGRIGLNWTANPGEFSFRNAANTASSQNFTGEQTVVWVQNNSGAVVSYMAPDGTASTLNAGFEDLWIGNNLVFNETPCVTSSRTLRRIKFILNAGTVSVSLDNMLVAPITPAPTANAAQSLCGLVNPTLANLSATGTALKWYASPSGGSPLPLSTPLTNGSTWYVSQTQNSIESIRTPVTVSLFNVSVDNNLVSADQVICTGTVPDTLDGAIPNISGGTGSFSYAWEVSSTSAIAGFSAISGATGRDLLFTAALTSNRWYRRRVTADGCIHYSNVVALTVNQPVSGNTVSTPSAAACSVLPASNINASNPSGGNGVYFFQWESSTSGSTGPFSAIASSNTQNLSPGIITQITWFRRIVSSGACASSTSNVVQLLIDEPITVNDAFPVTSPICSGTIPETIPGSIPAGGNGSTYVYQWESTTTFPGGSWGNASSTVSSVQQNLTRGITLSQNIWYRRRVSSGTCPVTYSDTIPVLVNAVIGSNSIAASGSGNVCSAIAAPIATGNSASGGTGTYVYQWESSETSSTTGFTAIPGANTQNYSPGLLSQNTWFRRVITSGVCPASTSNVLAYTVSVPVTGNDASGGPQIICTGSIPGLLNGSLPSGGTGTYSYQWQQSSSMGGSYSNISGANSQNYQPPALSSTVYYRRQISSGACPNTFSDTIQVTVNALNGSNSVSAAGSLNVCSAIAAPAANGNAATGGTGVYNYQWESSTTSGTAGFSPISGANSQNYSPGLLAQNTWIRRIISSGVCPATTSNVLAYNVTVPITSNDASPVTSPICVTTIPETVPGSLPSGGNGTFTYLWEQNTSFPSSSWGSATGTNNQQNYIRGQTLPVNIWLRRRVSSGNCPATYSDTISILVNATLGSNSISAAASLNICSSNPAPLANGNVASGGSGAYLYQWESSSISGTTGFSPITGANSQNYAPGFLNQSTWLRRVITAGVCPGSVSNVLAYSVTLPIENNDASGGPQTICNNTIPGQLSGSLPTGGNGVFNYVWETSTTSAAGPYGSSSGVATQQNYQPPALTQTRWYRRRVSSGNCLPSYSGTLQITVNPVISGNTITPNSTQNVCSANIPPAFTGSLATGGNGSMSYQWESSTSSASAGFSAIPGANFQSYAPGLLSQTTWFRRVATAGVCPASISNVTQYVISNPIVNNDIDGAQTICQGTAPSVLTGSLPSGGTGSGFTYQWESSTSASGPFSNVSGGNGQNLASGTLSSSRWFRRRVTSGTACPFTFSDTIPVTVVPAISNNSISVPSGVCLGGSPSLFNGSLPSGGIGTYDFQWEISTVSSTGPFSEISGATSQTFASGPISVDSWFRRRVISGVCTSYSSVPKITVFVSVTNNDITGNQEICPGTVPDTLRGSLPSGGTGTYTISWLSSTVSASGPFASTFSTGVDYIPGAVFANTWFVRRITSSSVCPPSFSDTVLVQIYTPISNNTIFNAQVVCDGSLPQPIDGLMPAGGSGTYTFEWQVSSTGPSSGFVTVPGETGDSIVPPAISDTVWYRRIVYSGNCQSISPAVQLSTSPNPTVQAGPVMADVVQGGISDALGGSFGGSASGAIWTASEGSFFGNGGFTPQNATFKASLNSSPIVTLTLTTFGGACGTVSVNKTINVLPDLNGITGVVNQYGQVTGPANLPVGSLLCTLAAGEGSRFAKNDRALIIQMKGASVNLPSNPTAVTYGYLTELNNSGNHEFLNIDSVSGDVIFFQRCIKKAYTISGAVQLVKVPVFNGNYNVKSSTTVSAIRLLRKGMGYPANAVLNSGFTITPVQGGSGLQLEARTDELGQIYEINILDPGNGYLKPPLISLPDPTVPPFDLPAYKAKALAIMGMTAKQWNGRTGGIFCMEVNGNLTLNDSINLEGMGFSGGMIGDRGDVVPVCGATAEFSLPFSSYERAGQKGEGIAALPSGLERGRGRFGTGGGGGLEPEGGGGGGANWQDGGRGGASGYVAIPLSACSTSVTLCDNDPERGGLGGGTNPSVPASTNNVIRSNSYFYSVDKCRIFMGGGGGGGHAFNFSRGTQFGGAGGFGGGIIIMKGSNLKSNGMAIKANGSDGENADQDGAGGGGAGGAFLLDFQSFTGSLRARVNGGKGGDAIPLACDDPGDNSYSIRYRYSAAGGGGGGGVVWLSQPNEDVFDLTFQSNFAQAPAGSNSDLFNSLAAPGGPSRSQSDLFFIENIPIGNSVLTVGGTSPEPDFPNLAKAAEFLSLAATDAPEITLLLAPNLSNATTLAWYKDPVVFKPIFTPACQVSEAKLLIKPRTGINTVNIQNEVDDITFIKAEGLPQITFKDLTISATEQDISTSIVSENGSRLIFDNVTVKADVTSLSNGSNEITLINSTHEGSIVVGQNQRLKLEGSLVRMNGDSIQGRSVTLGPGSAFYLGDGKTLDLNGVSWINNGADTVEISSSANLRLSGNFKNQQIGGIVPSSFNRVDITSSGKITLNSTVNAFHWNQTGAATVINENNQFLNVKNIITTGTGSFTSIGFGRVRLQADGSSPVEISGRFGNLELISPSGALATGQVDIDQNLILSDGIFYSDSLNPRLNIANTDPFSIVSLSPESWVNGILNRKVAAGGLYSFPVGDRFRPQTLSLNLNSLSGGLSAVNVKFVPSDPHSHPQESVVLTHEDDNIIFREVLPGGYWSVNPDSGSANYNVWLYPKFYGNFPQYSVMKRSGGGNEWKVYGNLENPDSTYSFIQNDSSVRRSGLIGFSDFAVAGGEDPLPLHFLDFRVSNKLGTPQLNWIMAECAEGTRFHVWRGLSKSSLQKTSQYLDAGNRNCLKQFEFADEAAGKPLRNLYYRIEANAPGELSAFSEIRSFSPVAGEKQKASIAAIPGMPGQFLLLGDGVNPESVALYATDGRLLKFNPGNGSSLLDLQQYPAGMYVVEFEQDGVKSRQRIVVSH